MASIDKIRVNGTDYDIEGKNIYSTNEKQIGTWIDGKPLYKITIQDTIPTPSTDRTVTSKTINISALNWEYINIEEAVFIFFGANRWQSYSLPYSTSDNSYKVYTYIYSDSDLRILNNRIDYGGADVYITLYYTKTTDVSELDTSL